MHKQKKIGMCLSILLSTVCAACAVLSYALSADTLTLVFVSTQNSLRPKSHLTDPKHPRAEARYFDKYREDLCVTSFAVSIKIRATTPTKKRSKLAKTWKGTARRKTTPLKTPYYIAEFVRTTAYHYKTFAWNRPVVLARAEGYGSSTRAHAGWESLVVARLAPQFSRNLL